MIKLSKNNVDKMGIITYNKDTLKNGHQTDAPPDKQIEVRYTETGQK